MFIIITYQEIRSLLLDGFLVLLPNIVKNISSTPQKFPKHLAKSQLIM